METKLFLITLVAALVFLAVISAVQTPTFFATGNVTLNTVGEASEIRVFFNGTEGNVTFEPGDVINITALLNISNQTIYMDINMTGWDVNSGNTTIQNITQFNDEGFFNVTVWFPGDVNNTPTAVTYFVTIESAAAPPGPGPGVGGGGVPIITPPSAPPSDFIVDIINPDEAEIIGVNLGPGNYFGDLSNATELPITGIGLVLKYDVDFFKIIIENVSKPPEIPGLEESYGLEMPYQYIKVTVIGVDSQEAFRTISMNFKVERDWVLSNNIDGGTVGLYRYQNTWRPISVIRTGGDFDYSRFHAGDVTVLSSYFVVSGKQLIALPSLLVPSLAVAPMTYVQLASLLFVILILILIILAKRRKKKEELVIEEGE